MITGIEAARLHGVRHLPSDSRVHVLIPHDRRVATRGFAVVERTIHPPEPETVDGLPVAPLARALIDAAHRMDSLNDIRAMIADAVQRELCHPRDLRHELEQGTTIGSALPRIVVEEMDRGIRSAAEAWAARVARRSTLPEPQWNVEIHDEFGTVLGIVDAWWPEAGLAWEIDSLDFHLNPNDYERTVRKHSRLTAAGVVVMHTLPTRLRRNPQGVIAELRAAYAQARSRPPPNVRARLWRPAA
ncbi:hypothetical protein B0I33_1148 [Prauserella shujinwangii]|uniref:DUF559 domain-containing protein n=2 Tax=Prauserella shujinwangii TaxID=1453103 RepID=A0A2T0LKQ8_9PSEU|nr:hypothetical protein B0I33_1148 [Prauserella shujinwangii]